MNDIEAYFSRREEEYNECLDSLMFSFPVGFKIKDKDLRSFLNSFLVDYNQYYVSVSKNDSKMILTYSGARRSLREIYILTREHFGEVSLYEVARELASLVMDEDSHIFCNFCLQIKELVFFFHGRCPDECKDEIYSNSRCGLLQLNEYGYVSKAEKNVDLYNHFEQMC